jgi:phosphatidylserine/phosphatidylglycerophosphate/cardiolipin synthase-like enzyme
VNLSGVSSADLRRLRDALVAGHLPAPVTALALSAAGLRLAEDVVEQLRGAERAVVIAACDAALAERGRPTPHVDLVWTGPDSTQSAARYTGITVAELFEGAAREVLIAGYSFDHGQEILAPLHVAMAERGVKVTMIVDVKRGRRRDDEARHAMITIDQLLHRNWTFGEPHPEVYYDPRTATAESLASMHAKCIVIDRQKSLVGSANFTDRGHTRNIEVGALIDDANFADRLLAQWYALISAGVLKHQGE